MTVMKVRLHGIAVSCEENQASGLNMRIIERLGDARSRLQTFEIVRRSIDARRQPVHLVYSVDVLLTGNEPINDALPPPPTADLCVTPGCQPLRHPPLIIGAGPAGLMAGYLLARHGYRPVLLDRGGDLAQRNAALRQFHDTRQPDPECNALFGLGGAGTFSDGKLTTSLSHPWIGAVLDVLIDCGAPAEIRIQARPHIGTDVLQGVVANLVAHIRSMGGAVVTGERLNNIETRCGQIAGAITSKTERPVDVMILAIGHSARDTIVQMQQSGISIAPKPFQIGVRVEHPQRWVDERQYGISANNPLLGAAEYKLTTRVDGIPVFSFCMCPGGEIMPTINESGHLCINGMSRHARDSRFACSGIVATVTPEMSGAVTARAAIDRVRNIEQACFRAGNNNYSAPAQDLLSFLKVNKNINIKDNSYSMGLTPFALETLFPSPVGTALRKAFAHFDRSMPGYIHAAATVVAPEARASSPVRMLRDRETRESVDIRGVYPVGEGAGHAGGIMSAALDGLQAARHIIERYALPAVD